MQTEGSDESIYMSALGFLYDALPDLAAWFRRLTPGQVQEIAKLMAKWHAPPKRAGVQSTHVDQFSEIQPLNNVERDAIVRALQLTGGDVVKAAAALHIGKTTIYRRLREWNYETKVILQASALANGGPTSAAAKWLGTATTSNVSTAFAVRQHLPFISRRGRPILR